jgi:hypothetical protein
MEKVERESAAAMDLKSLGLKTLIQNRFFPL